MIINTAIITQYLPLLAKGFQVSLQIALLGSFVGIVIGTVLGLIFSSKITPLKILAHLYVTIIRGTPMLVQIAGVFYLLQIAGIPISAFYSAIISIGLNSGAYVSQIILSGIKSVDKGQVEAAQTLGFTQLQTIQFIILPQAVRNVIPALGNEFVTLIKDSSLASTIGVYELTKQSEIMMSQTFDAPTVYITIACIYLVATTTLTFGINYLDKKMNYYAKH